MGSGGQVRAIAVGVIVLAGFAAGLVANYPGHFTPDSLWQLAQGREGVFNDWHPPVMAFLLGLADRLQPGAWPFVAANAALFYGAMLALALFQPRPPLAGLLVLALWMATPLALIYQGIVLKDVLFANASLAGFAALAWAGRLWERRARRNALLILSALLFALACLARQNAVMVPLCAALALMIMARESASPGDPRRSWAGPARLALLGLAVVAALATGATLALEAHTDHRPQAAEELKLLQVYDLAGALHIEPGLPLPVLDQRQPALARFLRSQAGPAFQPRAVDNIRGLPGGGAMAALPGRAVGDEWLNLIRGRPDLYVRIRMEIWGDTVLTPSAEACPMVFVGVDPGEPLLLRRAGLAARETDKDDWDSDYAQAFIGSPVLSHLAYGALAMAAAAVSLWRRRRGDHRPGRAVTLAAAAAGLLFAASFFVLSVACDYRYLYFLDVAAMAAALIEASAPPADVRSSRVE